MEKKKNENKRSIVEARGQSTTLKKYIEVADTHANNYSKCYKQSYNWKKNHQIQQKPKDNMIIERNHHIPRQSNGKKQILLVPMLTKSVKNIL